MNNLEWAKQVKKELQDKMSGCGDYEYLLFSRIALALMDYIKAAEAVREVK